MHNLNSKHMKFWIESIYTLHYVIIQAHAYSRKQSELQNAIAHSFVANNMHYY
jgi:hypothetical protein